MLLMLHSKLCKIHKLYYVNVGLEITEDKYPVIYLKNMKLNLNMDTNLHDNNFCIILPYSLRQLDTVLEKNDAVHSTLLAISTTFGEHPLHHLFPTVCQSKLSMLKPIFEQTLEEFQTKNRKVTQLELFRGTYQQYMRDKELTYDERKKNLP